MRCLRAVPYVMLLALGLGLAMPATAQRGFTGDADKSERSRQVPGLDKVDVKEQLKEKLPLDLTFTNHEGEKVQLGDFFDGKHPVLLTFNYYTCPVLCSMILESTAKATSNIGWTPGKEYELVTISIDPRDTPKTARKKRKELFAKHDESLEDWHFLVGSKKNIDKAADAAGIDYFYNEAQEQYAHPAVITFLTPDARFARYLYGLQYNPKDVRLALLEASKGKAISTVEKAILYCYRYNPDKSSYTLLGWRVMQIGSAGTVIALGVVLAMLWRYERRRKRRAVDDQEPASKGQAPAHGNSEVSST